MSSVRGMLRLIWKALVGFLKAIHFGFTSGFKWVVLALSLLSFGLAIHFLVNGPYALTNPSWARYYIFYRPSSSSSPVMAASFLLIGLFLVNHFRLLRAKAQRGSE